MLSHEDARFSQHLATVQGAKRWLLAFSGGLDSTALLRLLLDWRQQQADTVPPIEIVHVHHGMQAQADSWADHCRDQCQALQLPFQQLDVSVEPAGTGPEEAARRARYGALEAAMQPGDVMFFAHHLDDQVETFFLRLLRGAGPTGLSAMPVQRQMGPGSLLRPLLHLSRQNLLAYAEAKDLSWIEDPSNTDTDFDRNYLRSEVLPVLAQRWPQYRGNIERSVALIQAESELLQQSQAEVEEVHSVLGDPGIRLADLGDRQLAAVLLRQWLQQRGLRAPDSGLIAEFIRQLWEADADKSPRLACADFVLQRYQQAVFLLPWREPPPRPLGLSLAPGQLLELPHGGRLSLQQHPQGEIELPATTALSVKWREGGERITLADGKSRSLKKLLQQAQVPPWWRDFLPLLYCGEQLVAIAGVQLDTASGKGIGPRFRLHWQPE